jgi:hypothetical protein
MGVLQYDETRKEPLTMNITGRLYDDQKVLAIAYAFEQATKHRYAAPLAPSLPGEVFTYNSERKRAGGENGPTEDDIAPLLSVNPAATISDKKSETPTIKFSGTVKDLSGVDRFEVAVGGFLIPATIDSTHHWTAVVPPDQSASLIMNDVSSVDVLVLAVDLAGNAASETATVKL